MRQLLISILVLLSFSVYSQRNSGFKIGSNYSWIISTRTSDPYFNNNYELDPSLTFHFGYSWNIKVVEKFSIQTDLIYNWMGSTAVMKDPFSFDESNILIGGIGMLEPEQFITLPITLNYMVLPNLFVEFGGVISLAPYALADNLWDFGIAGGFGYSTKYIDFSLRYIHGLSSSESYASSSHPSSGDPNVYVTDIYFDKYRTFQISLTIPVFKYFKRSE